MVRVTQIRCSAAKLWQPMIQEPPGTFPAIIAVLAGLSGVIPCRPACCVHPPFRSCMVAGSRIGQGPAGHTRGGLLATARVCPGAGARLGPEPVLAVQGRATLLHQQPHLQRAEGACQRAACGLPCAALCRCYNVHPTRLMRGHAGPCITSRRHCCHGATRDPEARDTKRAGSAAAHRRHAAVSSGHH